MLHYRPLFFSCFLSLSCVSFCELWILFYFFAFFNSSSVSFPLPLIVSLSVIFPLCVSLYVCLCPSVRPASTTVVLAASVVWFRVRAPLRTQQSFQCSPALLPLSRSLGLESIDHSLPADGATAKADWSLTRGLRRPWIIMYVVGVTAFALVPSLSRPLPTFASLNLFYVSISFIPYVFLFVFFRLPWHSD